MRLTAFRIATILFNDEREGLLRIKESKIHNLSFRRFSSAAAAVVAVAGLTALSSWSAEAAPIFSNFGPSQNYDVTQGLVVGNAFDGNNYAEGSTFTPSSNTTFGSLSLALSCAVASCSDPFTVSLSLDSGSDTPGTMIESFTRTGALLGGFGIQNAPLVFSSALSPTLTSGAQYWVTVSSDALNSIVWNANTTGDVSDQAISTDGGATWFSPSGLTPGAYEVDSIARAVPEPASWAMMLLGIGGIGATMRSQRRNLLDAAAAPRA